MDDDQQFCLRWNNHQSTLISVFDTLLEKGMHVDCTLAAEGQTLKAHKVVLSACSPYFENVLSQQYDKHPIIILKDVKYAELRAMMDYMYRGEVNISQDQLAALLKAAESLQIKGLSDNKPARPPGVHAPRQPSPTNKGSDGSVGSREGSASPTRRRKKARRASLDGLPVTTIPGPMVTVAPPTVTVPLPLATDEPPLADLPPTELKVEEGSRGPEGEGVEDLTMEEENEEPLPAHNDVVRNFQWHMERSQDEMMNTDGTRDSQGSAGGKNVDQLFKHRTIIPENASTFAVLRNVVIPNEEILSPKFEDIDDKQLLKLPILPEEKETPITKPLGIMPAEIRNVTPIYSENESKADAEQPKVKPVVKKRGRPPLKRDKDAEEKSKTTKKGQEEAKKDKVQKKVDKNDETAARKKGGDTELERKASVYDFDFYGSDSGMPLPCSEYKTEKGYKCPNCQRCYNARKNLVRHITLECGRDPQYQCPHCPYSKHRRNELKKHIQKKHSNEPEKLIKRKLT